MVQIAAVVLVAYAVLVGTMYVFQRSLMYRPGASLPALSDTLVANAQVRRIGAPASENVSWYLPPTDGNPVIVYCQGNAGTIADRDYKAALFAEAGYGVWLVGYRGFGGNPGAPTEQGLYGDLRDVVTALAEDGVGHSRIVLYGESLGTGVATHIAHEMNENGTPARALILEAPFTSMGAAAQGHYRYIPAKLLVRDRYENIAKISDIGAPLLIMHGDNDGVVPQHHGKALFAAAAEPKKGFWPEGGAHSNLADFGAGQRVLDFLSDI